jgi:flagellar biosynthetic protein FlhB
MSDDSFQEKTEAPTPKKREDAFKKGEVPRSQELTTAFLLLAGAGALASASTATGEAVMDIFGLSVGSMTALPVGADGSAAFLRAISLRALGGMAPMLLVVSGMALAVAAIQARGALSVDPLMPKWSRMDPVKRIPQIWGTKAIAEFLKSLLKLTLVGGVVWSAGRKTVGEASNLGQQPPFALLVLIRDFAVRMLVAAGIAYLFLALADYAYQIWQHEKQLKMGKEEVRKEVKESEGDQVVKVRRRTMARQLARRRMMLSVSDADVVVTNPTHIAVALKYDPSMADAPVVLAMGERKVAERIKALAKENGITTVENKPLARALFATARVGAPVPVELFVAVAEILAWVYRQAGYRPGQRPNRAWQGAEA